MRVDLMALVWLCEGRYPTVWRRLGAPQLGPSEASGERHPILFEHDLAGCDVDRWVRLTVGSGRWLWRNLAIVWDAMILLVLGGGSSTCGTPSPKNAPCSDPRSLRPQRAPAPSTPPP